MIDPYAEHSTLIDETATAAAPDSYAGLGTVISEEDPYAAHSVVVEETVSPVIPQSNQASIVTPTPAPVNETPFDTPENLATNKALGITDEAIAQLNTQFSSGAVKPLETPGSVALREIDAGLTRGGATAVSWPVKLVRGAGELVSMAGGVGEDLAQKVRPLIGKKPLEKSELLAPKLKEMFSQPTEIEKYAKDLNDSIVKEMSQSGAGYGVAQEIANGVYDKFGDLAFQLGLMGIGKAKEAAEAVKTVPGFWKAAQQALKHAWPEAKKFAAFTAVTSTGTVKERATNALHNAALILAPAATAGFSSALVAKVATFLLLQGSSGGIPGLPGWEATRQQAEEWAKAHKTTLANGLVATMTVNTLINVLFGASARSIPADVKAQLQAEARASNPQLVDSLEKFKSAEDAKTNPPAESPATTQSGELAPIKEILSGAVEDKTQDMSLRRKAMALTVALEDGRISETEAQKRWSDYTATNTFETIKDLVDSVVAHPGTASKMRKAYDSVTESQVKDIQDVTGIDVSGYSHEIDGSAISHILKHHEGSNEKNAQQIPLSKTDLQEIPDIVRNYDTVEYVGKSNIGKDTIRYKKRHNGITFFLEEIRTGRKTLSAVSMWKVATGTNDMPSRASSHTSETLPGGQPSGDTIPQSGENVNTPELGKSRGGFGNPHESFVKEVLVQHLDDAIKDLEMNAPDSPKLAVFQDIRERLNNEAVSPLEARQEFARANDSAGGSVEAGAPTTELGGQLGKPGEATKDPSYSRIPLQLPELVQFAMYLSKNGAAPMVKKIVKLLNGTALGVFKARVGDPTSGHIEMRQDLFRRLTERQEQELRGQAAEYATNNKLTNEQAKDYYESIRKTALREAEKTGPVMALKVLAHEIGHWVGFLPDGTLSRGNLLGHIAGLWHYTKRFLTDSPDDQSLHISPKEKERRRRAAEKQLREELGTVKEIVETIIREEPVYKETGLTAENIREFFGTSAREDMPEAYMWFAGLDPATKKEIVKKAMRGILDERASRFVRKEQVGTRTVTEEKRTVTGGREPTKLEIKQRFVKLMKEEIERRRLIELEAIKAELEPLIAWWRGTEKMEDYFRDPKEMYAEAFSILMNNPVALESRAPLFWRAWNNYVDARSEALNMYEKLQEMMKTGGRLQFLRERVRSSMRDVAEQGIAITEFSGKLTKQEKKDRRLYTFDRVFGPMYSRLAPHLRKGSPDQQRGAAKVQQSIDDFRYKAIEHERYLRKMNQDVSKNLVDAGLDWMDLGEYMLYKHIAENRPDIASPLGIDVKNARELLKEMETNFGPEKMNALEEAQAAWWQIRQEMIIDPLAAAGLLPPELLDVMKKRDFYATISAAITGKPVGTLETLLEQRYGANTGARILKQEGWLGETGNPATALVAKDLSLISWVHQQSAVREIVGWLARNDTTLDGKPMVREADTRWTGRHNEPIEIENDRLGTLMFMHNGKLQAWYVPRTIADAFNAKYSLAENTLVKFIVSGNGVLKGLYTQWNYGFWPFNFLRDLRALTHNVPGTTAWRKLREIPAGIRLARQTAGLEPLTPEAESYMNRKMMGAHAEPMGVGHADREFEQQLERYSIRPETWNKEAVAPLGRLKAAWQHYLTFGTVIERAVKIAGARYLDKNYPDMPEWKKREIVHEMAGSPDFWNKAKANPTLDAIQLFYNARKEGYRSAYKSFKEHPIERMWKTAKFTLLPSMLMTAAASKLLSKYYTSIFGDDNEDLQDFEEAYRYVSTYDMDNYEIVPMTWVDKTGTIRKIGSENLKLDKRGWKVMYARMPMDQGEQLIHGLTMKVMREGKAPAGYEYLDVLTFASGELPTGNPIWNSTLNLGLYYFAGVNPVDLRTGKTILQDDVAIARDSRAATELAKWTANQYGSMFGRFQPDRLDKEKPTSAEKFLKLPVMSNLAGRFVKISDQGIYDEVAKTEGKITQQDARTRLDALEGLRQEQATGQLPAWVVERMGKDPYFTKYYTEKRSALNIQKMLTPKERAIIKPKSGRSREQVMKLESQKKQ